MTAIDESVNLTRHGTERTDGNEKARCRLPESVIRNIILQRKGNQYEDIEKQNVNFVYNATVIVADYDPEQRCWNVITVWRDKHADAKRGTARDRFQPVDVDRLVAAAHESPGRSYLKQSYQE